MILHNFKESSKYATVALLHHIGTIYGSSTILQVANVPLWDIFTLKGVPLHEHLQLVAFHHYNCCGVEVLKNASHLLVLLLLLEL